MSNDNLFVSVPNPQPGGAYRREAARLRRLATSATTPVMRKHLEDRARAHDRLADSHAETC